MSKKNDTQLNSADIVFIILSCLVCCILLFINQSFSFYSWVNTKYGGFIAFSFLFIWVYHLVISRKRKSLSVALWFAAAVTMAASNAFFWSYSLSIIDPEGPMFSIGWSLLLLGMVVYGFVRFSNGWLACLMIVFIILAYRYPLSLLYPPKTENTRRFLFYFYNGSHLLLLIVAAIQSSKEIYQQIRKKREKRKEEQARRRAEDEAARLRTRRNLLPLEMEELNAYSLNISSFLDCLQKTAQTNKPFDQMLCKYKEHSIMIKQMAKEKNEEAIELGIAERASVHSR